MSAVTGIQLKAVEKLSHCEGKPLFLPNSVGLFADGSIVVADGGNDRICLFNPDGKPIKAVGSHGFSRLKFKEPVGVFVSPEQQVYVADWHNHRIVILDNNLNYLDEFGHFGRLDSGLLRRMISFLKQLGHTGSYLQSHFQVSQQHGSNKKLFSFREFVSSASYWFFRLHNPLQAIIKILDHEFLLAKPNGVSFADGKLVVSQKDNRCLSEYLLEDDGKRRLLAHRAGPDDTIRFGRLGNVLFGANGMLYVCDEREETIWELDNQFKVNRAIQDSGAENDNYLPFSCSFLTPNHLIVCCGIRFQVVDLRSGKWIYRSEELGELHGVTVDETRKRFYVSDRLGGQILAYEYEVHS